MIAEPIYIIIPNWNGREFLPRCLDSLRAQSLAHRVIVVDNGSTDGSIELINADYPEVELIRRDRNYGFTGAVNPGLQVALDRQADYAALLNNDAVAEPDWLKHLVDVAEASPATGIVATKIKHLNDDRLDSTGDGYSIWALPYPRGRDEIDRGQYDAQTELFGASGGASLYRVEMLRQIGLFDDRFFAYFEDTDLSFRAQLAGWRVTYAPAAVVRHAIGGTSGRHHGLARFHTVKNFHYVYTKNMPTWLWWKYLPLYWLMTGLMLGSDLKRGLWRQNLRANLVALRTLPAILADRRRIQRRRRVTTAYIDGLLLHQLPPTQRSFAKLRQRLFGRSDQLS